MFYRTRHHIWWPWKVGVWDRFKKLSGWRKSAVINTVLVSMVFLILLSSQIYIWTKSGSLGGYQVIRSGSCAGNGIGRLNTLLHLFINILSTLVLASTNFFMQILNAPSREELDSAHERGSWLDIGVPSLRNAFKVSNFKTVMWLLFCLSSVPIHLLFNSAIFAIDDRGSTFSYFVFDESVLHGGAVFDPGTSISVPYAHSIYPEMKLNYYNYSTNTWENTTTLEIARERYFEMDHDVRSRVINRTVEEIVKGKWHKLDKSRCNSLYSPTSCAGLQAYRNVALILSGSSGWNRSQVWDAPVNESSFWDTYVPNIVNNSLWLAHSSNYSRYPCSMKLSTKAAGVGTQIYCNNNCSFVMGLDAGDADAWNYSLFPDTDYPLYIYRTALIPFSPRKEFEDSLLSIEYCLAEPFETVCRVGLASGLVSVISVCVLLKAILCIVVIIKLGEKNSLVTPGDVIESFISQPPNYPLGSCILEQNLLESLRKGKRHTLIPGPTQWTSKRCRRWHAIPTRIWLSSYSIFLIGIALLIYFSATSYPVTGLRGSFGQDTENQTIAFPNEFSPTFEQAILIANSPQLLLSCAYFAFNSLFTRLNMAKEWSAMSTRYKALRVTNPRGQQSSTYFLQLPFRYSVPLIIVSILLHWVLSGCIYLLVMEGAYLYEFGSGGPFSSLMAVGFSTKSLITMMALSIAVTFTPPIFGRIALPVNSVVVGSNSLAIAAACQVSPLIGQTEPQPERSYQEYTSNPRDDIELHHLMTPSPSFVIRTDDAPETWTDEESRKATLRRVSQSKIRWGVVKMPPYWAEQFIRREPAVEHISFGLPEDDVQQPIEGHWYV